MNVSLCSFQGDFVHFINQKFCERWFTEVQDAVAWKLQASLPVFKLCSDSCFHRWKLVHTTLTTGVKGKWREPAIDWKVQPVLTSLATEDINRSWGIFTSLLCLYLYPVSYYMYGDADPCNCGTLSEDIYTRNTAKTLHKTHFIFFEHDFILYT